MTTTERARTRSIHEFIPDTTSAEDLEAPENQPTFVGHLLEMPLTNGEEALIDPDNIDSVSAHRTEANVTVIRQRDDKYTYFVKRHYNVVKSWVRSALKE